MLISGWLLSGILLLFTPVCLIIHIIRSLLSLSILLSVPLSLRGSTPNNCSAVYQEGLYPPDTSKSHPLLIAPRNLRRGLTWFDLNYGFSIATNCVQNVTIIVNWRVLQDYESLLLFTVFFLPVIRTHRTCQNHFLWQFFISFSQKISRIFHSALPDQLRNQPDMSCSEQIIQTLFNQTDSLAFGRYAFKNLRMFCLRYTKIKISVKLLLPE